MSNKKALVASIIQFLNDEVSRKTDGVDLPRSNLSEAVQCLSRLYNINPTDTGELSSKPLLDIFNAATQKEQVRLNSLKTATFVAL